MKFEAQFNIGTPEEETKTVAKPGTPEKPVSEEQEYTIVDHLEKQNEPADEKSAEQEYTIVDHLEKQNEESSIKEKAPESPEKADASPDVETVAPSDTPEAVAQEQNNAAIDELNREQEKAQLEKLIEAAIIQNKRLSRLEQKLELAKNDQERATWQERIADTEVRYQMLQKHAQELRAELYPARERTEEEAAEAQKEADLLNMEQIFEDPDFLDVLSKQERQLDPTIPKDQDKIRDLYLEFSQDRREGRVERLGERRADLLKAVNLLRKTTGVGGFFRRAKALFSKERKFSGLDKPVQQQVDQIAQKHKVKPNYESMLKALQDTSAQLGLARNEVIKGFRPADLRVLQGGEEQNENDQEELSEAA
ncbi:MAG: hypothetical protein COU11_00085 [Candidatus Harrisonbacteria bacterium CG10_big_fil_rev_8_21_14_0_10_49_15]|uniref:Uncharacterized protein n=1 Tax=Candidatus Harrisonbacteria bacterium CG10_big_fil_rev_8_21_14_0_10_49_15 TaxID=1974587 RepID=A0A2H0UM51_9BACT|nr:MAG: hypothetical protein COU11_00085 [Candidatus Harrisonbacteria bacterium CG10_big_fil_rev_8_21_14_0_10_49_15]